MQKTILVITDGIGHNEDSYFNAFKNANTPNFDKLFQETPYALLKTYGHAVGLPKSQMGNSEVGHMTIGSGRVIYQDLEKISFAIEDKTILQNKNFQRLLTSSNTLHIIGLTSDGGVHSHINHIIGITKLLKDSFKKIYLHLITDGRDVSPTSSPGFIKQIEDITDDKIKIATISGRFYTMDRDKRWDRVKKGYDAIVLAKPLTKKTPQEYIKAQYEQEITDEFIEPVALEGYDGLKDDDAILMINFRSDRVRQISKLLGDKDFMPIDVDKKDVKLFTMTEYAKEFTFPVIFTKEIPKNTLAEVISKAGLRQFHTAETEKYAHVTFFLNGGVEEPYKNETRVLIPSPKVKTYDMKPQMSAYEVKDAVLKAMEEEYDFIVVNFANGDMVGHTGNYEAAIKAVEAVDECIGEIVNMCDQKDYSLILSADHGNCEKMRDKDNNILTNHTVGEVYCFVRDKRVTKISTKGGLSNIAPTVLKLMGLEIPKEMDEALYYT